MSRTQLARVRGDTEFVRAAWEHMAHIADEYGAVVRYTVRTTNRKGVLLLTAQAWDTDTRADNELLAVYSTEFPTADLVTFTAVLSGLLYGLEEKLAKRRDLGAQLDLPF